MLANWKEKSEEKAATFVKFNGRPVFVRRDRSNRLGNGSGSVYRVKIEVN